MATVAHDPLCPQVAKTPPLTWCLCEHNARVRADERERVYAEFQYDYADDVVLKTLRAQIAAEIEAQGDIQSYDMGWARAHAAAARIARGTP